jgi:adenosine kinase
MPTLVCGSIAYDNIMVFHDRFKNHILPEQIHILNVAFLVPEMRREFGGCARNIAYNLKLLGDEPLIAATVGDDAGYLDPPRPAGLAARTSGTSRTASRRRPSSPLTSTTTRSPRSIPAR